MGASDWHYFVPYQPDISLALAQLQEEEFQRLQKWEGWKATMTFQEFAPLDPDYMALLGDKSVSYWETVERDVAYYQQLYEEFQKFDGVYSIDFLRRWKAQEGTHSILDISGVLR